MKRHYEDLISASRQILATADPDILANAGRGEAQSPPPNPLYRSLTGLGAEPEIFDAVTRGREVLNECRPYFAHRRQ